MQRAYPRFLIVAALYGIVSYFMRSIPFFWAPFTATFFLTAFGLANLLGYGIWRFFGYTSKRRVTSIAAPGFGWTIGLFFIGYEFQLRFLVIISGIVLLVSWTWAFFILGTQPHMNRTTQPA